MTQNLLCQQFVSFVLQFRETEGLQDVLAKGFEILLMLPITIIILDGGIFECLRLIGKESVFNKHCLTMRQKSATNTPGLVVGVGPGYFADILPVSLLVSCAEYPMNLKTVMKGIAVEAM